MLDKDKLTKADYKTIDSENLSADDKKQKLKQLKALVPDLFNSDGLLNIAALENFVGSYNTASMTQSYGLNFAGKALARLKSDATTSKELKLENKESKNADKTGNIIIRGDNLDALKLLRQNYEGQVKMIYIDPPYNTGNARFVYSDNFREKEADMIEKYDLDEEQIKFFENLYGTQTHSGWLYFMYPRLRIARDLLAHEGVIFISIDDNEQSNLKIMCDDIFGHQSYITSIPRITTFQRSGQESHMNISHDYILCYSYSEDFANIIEREINPAKIKSDKNGKYLDGDTAPILASKYQGYSKGGDYDFEYNGKTYEPVDKNGERNRWLWTKERMQAAADLGIIVETKGILRAQLYLDKKFEEKTNRLVDKDSKLKFHTADFMKNKKYSNATGTDQLFKLFGGEKVFDNPKPVDLIKDIIKLATDKQSLILDFFAGSGTTAEAVMNLNKEDGGTRKFILVQWDEKINKKKNSYSYEFCNNNKLKPVISSICIERVNRAGKNIQKGSEVINDELDIGYKVFSLTERAKLIVNSKQEIQLNVNRASTLDTLYNMMAASGEALLTDPIEEIEVDLLYKVNNAYYLLGNCEKDLKDAGQIFVDGYADISLEKWLNTLGIDKDLVSIIY